MQTSLSSALSTLGRQALRIVLPSWCDVCGRELPWRDSVASCCRSCWSLLPKITSAKCRSCALPLPGLGPQASGLGPALPSSPSEARGPRPEASSGPRPEASFCIACSADPLPVEWCDAWGEYSGGLERLLHAFKFGRHDFLDDSFAGLLHETLAVRGDLAFDAIVPVPMHASKERKRGYNQAQLLASALARRTGIAATARLLTKPAETPTQSTLSRGSRSANVRDAFSASPRAAGKAILVVDDICTTGETLRACARELLGAGAARVCAVTVAKAV